MGHIESGRVRRTVGHCPRRPVITGIPIVRSGGLLPRPASGKNRGSEKCQRDNEKCGELWFGMNFHRGVTVQVVLSRNQRQVTRELKRLGTWVNPPCRCL